MIEITLASLAAVFRTEREKHRLTQVELARRLGTSQSSISKIEAEKSEPSALLWLKFCAELGVRPDMITGVPERLPDAVESGHEAPKTEM